MGEFHLSGQGAAAALSTIVTHDLDTLAPGKCRYGFLCNEAGGVIDDLIVYCLDTDSYMSEMAPGQLVETVLTRLEQTGRSVLPLTYVNSSAAVKAACGKRGGAVCTSANAGKMLKWALDQGRGVLFLPDKMLGQNTCRTLGVAPERLHFLDVRAGGAQLDLDAAAKAEVLLWPGQCVIHSRFKPEAIAAVRAATPEAKVVVHPECHPVTVAAADAAGSTSFIIKYVADAPPGADIVIGTEIHLVKRLATEYQGLKTIRPLRVSECSNMASRAVLSTHTLVTTPATQSCSTARRRKRSGSSAFVAANAL